MNLYLTILVAIDLTPYSEETLKKAKLLADRLGSTLHLIHVVEPLPINAYPFMEGANGIQQQILEESTHKMQKKCQQYGISKSLQIIEIGSPKSTILEKAKAVQADLIVIGSHSNKGFAHLLGSTASSIVNSAQSDILVIYNSH